MEKMLSEGCFLIDWKRAFLMRVPKVTAKSSYPSQVRAILLLKLDERSGLSNYQSGFPSGRSTVSSVEGFSISLLSQERGTLQTQRPDNAEHKECVPPCRLGRNCKRIPVVLLIVSELT